MSLYTLIIVTFIIFMAINVIIGLRGRKHASTTKEFLTASGQSGIWFVIASAVGASIGSGVVIGTTQYAVKLGVAGAWYAIACGLACIVFALIMSRFVYRNKLVSFSDYFKRRYDSNFIVLLYSGIGPFACAASMGGQLVAAKAIFQAFGIDPTIGLVITAAVMLVYVRQNEPVDAGVTAVRQKAIHAVGEDDVRVGHKNHGDRHVAPQLAHKVKDLVGRCAALQSAQVCRLNHGPLRRGVREGNAELNEVGAVLRGSADGSRGRFKIGVAAGQKGDERLAVVKCSCKITHEDPPLCSGRWRRNPCRRGRRS